MDIFINKIIIMNRSYSKIKHIQISNLLLEQRRFKQLLESRIGDIRPLILENPPENIPTQNVDQSKTVKINGKVIPMYNEATKTNNTYKQLLFQAYNDIVQKVSEDEATNYDELAIYLKGNAIPYRLNCEDLETLTELPLESGTKTVSDLKPGDKVRKLTKNTFTKGTDPIWSDEVYTVVKATGNKIRLDDSIKLYQMTSKHDASQTQQPVIDLNLNLKGQGTS